jgi:glucokinase
VILLGLDPRLSGTLAVVVDDSGRVLARRICASITDALTTTHDGRSAASVGIVAHQPNGVSRAVYVSPAAATALAEAWTGAARGARHVVGLMLDSSIEAGIVIDGRLFAGAHGHAGAAGWMSLNPVERADYRTLGCLEAEVGAAGIVRRLVWRIKSGDRSAVEESVSGDLTAITPEMVFAAARDGDGVAVSVVRDTARYIGMAMANLVTILDPEVIVLGGIIAEISDLLLEPAATEMTRRIPPDARREVAVAAAALGADAAAVGAARAALLVGNG